MSAISSAAATESHTFRFFFIIEWPISAQLVLVHPIPLNAGTKWKCRAFHQLYHLTHLFLLQISSRPHAYNLYSATVHPGTNSVHIKHERSLIIFSDLGELSMGTLLEMPLTGNYSVQVFFAKDIADCLQNSSCFISTYHRRVEFVNLIVNIFCKRFIEKPKEY